MKCELKFPLGKGEVSCNNPAEWQGRRLGTDDTVLKACEGHSHFLEHPERIKDVPR